MVSSIYPGSHLRLIMIGLGGGGVAIGLAIILLTWGTGWSWAGAALMSFSPMIAARIASRTVDGAEMRPALRRYGNRLAAIMVVYFLVLMGAVSLYEQGLTAGSLGYVVALAPAAPLVGVFIIMGRLLREETDEFLREVTRTAFVWSGALTLCEATVWGFLETFGKVPHVWMWAVPVAFFAQLGLTGPLAARKYR